MFRNWTYGVIILAIAAMAFGAAGCSGGSGGAEEDVSDLIDRIQADELGGGLSERERDMLMDELEERGIDPNQLR